MNLQFFEHVLENNFSEMANKNVNYDSLITLWQAKCLVMRTLGIKVRQKTIVAILQECYDNFEQNTNNKQNNFKNIDINVPMPQLIALEASNDRRAEVILSKQSTIQNLDALQDHQNPGYLNFKDVQLVLDRICQMEGISDRTIAMKLYACFDSARKGYVEENDLRRCLNSLNKPALAKKSSIYFRAVDELNIGRMSTTQVMAVLDTSN